MIDWLQIQRGSAPLVLCCPHTGTHIPKPLERSLESPWLARKDTDWWVELLYGDIARELGATIIRTTLTRTVIDVNRDPDGTSLYPGLVTTELCPLTTFDGEALYRAGLEPGPAEIVSRRKDYFAPYHAAISAEINRLRETYARVVLYDAHSIRSRIPRLFPGLLPELNIGTNGDMTCDPALTAMVERICRDSQFSWITNGRFRGGWTTRHYGSPANGVHALQMELACRSYLEEPEGAPDPDHWPPAFSERRAEPLRIVLRRILEACLKFARGG